MYAHRLAVVFLLAMLVLALALPCQDSPAFCPACGVKNPAGALFCSECGASISGDEEPASQKSSLQEHLSKRVLRLQAESAIRLPVYRNGRFAEEDIPGLSASKLKEEITQAQGDLQKFIDASVKGRLVREGARVAFVGRPNVGKSSLFNSLLSTDRAIVTDINTIESIKKE